jgi:hypothetical protein
MGKDVTEVRSPHRKLMPDTVGPDPHEPTSLRGIANKARADKQHRFRDLYRCLDAHLLRVCWDDLNKAAARGVDHVTAAEYAVDLQANLEVLAQRLQSNATGPNWSDAVTFPRQTGKKGH